MKAIDDIDELLLRVVDRNEVTGVVAAVADHTQVLYHRGFEELIGKNF